MRNFAIHFQHPWLLLLLIPAFALTLLFYLLVNKRFRNTRNRIVSIVLHSLVMVLSIFALSGIFFTYEEAHLENEILLLVDVSETEDRSAERRDGFMQTVISECGYDGYKVGVVSPSITGFPASGPTSPNPNTAVPLLKTPIRLPLSVYLYTSSGSFSISKLGYATPGE